MTYFAGLQTNFMYAAQNGGNPFNPGNWNWKSPWTYINMTTAALGTYYDIGGLNGFSDVATGTPAAANTLVDNTGIGNYSRWLDYEKPMGYGLFASLDGGGGEIDTHLWIREVIIRSRQTSHQRTMANARSIHQAHAAFWRHPITRGVTTVLTSFVGGGIFSGMKNAYTAVKGYKYANVAKEGTQLGQSFGKLGTVVENPGLSITNFSKHGLNQTITRGVSPSTILKTVKNPVTVLKQNGGNYLHLTREAAVVLNPTGRVVPTYPASMFDSSILNVLKWFR